MVAKVAPEELCAALADEVPNHQWTALIDIGPPAQFLWRDGSLIDDPDALARLDVVSRPPPVPAKSEEMGGCVVCVADEEVQVYVRIRGNHFLGVGAQRQSNVGLVRSIVVRAARKLTHA